MKASSLLLFVFFATFFSGYSLDSEDCQFTTANSCSQYSQLYLAENGSIAEEYLFVDCNIRVRFELDDGSTIEGELTFLDVSWFECKKMQLAAWWHRNF
jgi:hypothetical protein